MANWSQADVDAYLATFPAVIPVKNPRQVAVVTASRLEMSEKEFQAEVEKHAKLFGWLVYHTHDSRRSAKGFPDLCLVRKQTIIFAELKAEGKNPTPAQQKWLIALAAAGQTTCVWRPSDIEHIVRVLHIAN